MQSHAEVTHDEQNNRFVFVHDWIERQARRYPGRAALFDEKGLRTDYATLIERSRRLVARLCAAGVGVEDRVAVCVDRPFDAIVSMLAVFSVGGVYVPLHPSQPPRRLATLLADLRPVAIIAEREMAAPHGIAVVTPEADNSLAGKVPDPKLRADHLAYVIYTSGSTGVPKGVAMCHAALTRLILWQVADGLPALATLQLTSLGFDVTFQEILSTLCSAGTLHLISDTTRRNPH